MVGKHLGYNLVSLPFIYWLQAGGIFYPMPYYKITLTQCTGILNVPSTPVLSLVWSCCAANTAQHSCTWSLQWPQLQHALIGHLSMSDGGGGKQGSSVACWWSIWVWNNPPNGMSHSVTHECNCHWDVNYHAVQCTGIRNFTLNNVYMNICNLSIMRTGF